MIRRIAINTGGGDAPGLNAVIRSVTLSACERGWEVLGIRRGYAGLLKDDPDGIVPLTRSTVSGIAHLGGTILGTTNRGDPFCYPVEQDGQTVARDVSAELVRRFKALGCDALVALGGDGSLSLAWRLAQVGLGRVIGVPKTIDNDLLGTDITFGFETAIDTVTDALDKLHTTTQAHQRVMVVEVMGRYAGWIALHSGISGGADVILIPEIPYDIEIVAEKVRARDAAGRGFSIIVVAEGAAPVGGAMHFQAGKEKFAEHARLGGIAALVAAQIEQRTGKECRSLVLGHLQRGGSPVTVDRILAQQLGCAATRYLDTTELSGMVAIRSGETELVPFEQVTGGIRKVGPESGVLRTARDLGLCFGDEPPGTFSGGSAASSLARPPVGATNH
jgi:phosphofructokinase-like protein